MRVILKNVRLSFPRLFEPEEFETGGTKRYSATFLVEPGSENDKNIQQAIRTVAEEKFGKKYEAMLKSMESNNNKYCYLDGNLKDFDGYEGMFYLSSHRKEQDGAPKVVDRNKDVELSADSGKPYAGCYVNGSVEIYAQTGQYAGIRAQLVAVQFVADGEAFAGSPATADDFDDLSDGTDDDLGFE